MMGTLHSTKQTVFTPLGLLTGLTITCSLPFNPPAMPLGGGYAIAQIVPDNSLGSESSIVVPNQNIRGIDSDRIDGGAIRGSNLFHSFQEFNIDNGRGAYFSNPENISNILSRVTGNNLSNILGTLGVLGNANLFLINPNGIVFGPNARLDVGGSFFASTADGILFENGVEFAASNPEAPPLLTINLPIGLNFRDNPGNIVNQSIAVDSEDNFVGLQVLPEKTLGLIGGNIQIDGGILTASQGRIELGSVAGNSQVNLTPIAQGYALGYENIPNFQDIALSQEAFVDVRGEGGGDIQIQGRRVTLTESSVIEASTLGSEPGGLLSIQASESVEVVGSDIFANVEPDATATGVSIAIDTPRLTLSDGARISASTIGSGDAGNLTITATDVELLSDSSLFASVLVFDSPVTGNAGTLTIDTQNLRVRDGSDIIAGTFNQGNGAEVIIRATGLVEVIGTSSSITSNVNPEATGNGGTLSIETQNLRVQDGGQILTSTFSIGDGGDLNITADSIELIGIGGLATDVLPDATGKGGSLTINTQNLRVLDGAFVSTSTFGNGDGGDLTINAQNLLVSNGSISTDTLNQGNAGQLIIRATELVEVTGTSSSISNSVGAEATGNGSTLSIETPNLQVREGGFISTDTFGSGDAGNLTINTQNLQARDGVFISTDTFGSGDAGNLTINTQNLQARDEALISASTFGGGDAGNLTITATDIILINGNLGVSVEPEGMGNAGNLTIDTQNLSVRDGAQIGAVTFGNGNAGNLTVTATDILLINGNLATSVGSGGVGNGGNLTINTQNLQVRDGAQIGAGTFGNGNAGDLTINATDIELVGTSADAPVTSSIFASVNSGATGNGGNLTINSQNLLVRDVAQISAGTSGNGDGGSLTINTQSLQVQDGAQISASTFGNGDGGNLTVTATDIELVGTSVDGQASSALEVSVQPEATGNGGVLIINTQNLLVRDLAQIGAITSGNGDGGDLTINATDILLINGDLGASVQSGATGNGGDLNINTQSLQVQDGAQILASTFGNGNAGNLTITATDIEIVGTGDDGQIPTTLGVTVGSGGVGNGGILIINTQNLLMRDEAQILASTFANGNAGDLTITANNIELIDSKLAASVEPGAVGNAGNLIINTQNLQLRDSAQIGAATAGNGNAGELIITAKDIELIGTSADGRFASSIFASVEPGATGNGGSLIIDTQNLRVLDGAQISTGTLGNGNAGNLTVTATDIEVVGTAANGSAVSGLFADVETESIGKGGELTVNADNLIVRDEARIDVRSEGTEAAGDLIINAPNILLDNEASLNGETTAGEGNIILNTDDLRLRNNSSITTNATGEATGGNITINTETLTTLENSDISANAEDDFGGRVIITADGILGAAFRDQQTRFSDITATSELGPEFSGTVELNTELDPSSALIELPQTVVNPNDLIAQEFCRQRRGSEFVITGKGGLAVDPMDKADGSQINVDLVEPVPSQPQNTAQRRSETEENQPISSLDIVPARGWIRDENGDVILVGYDPTKTGVQRQPAQLPHCQP